MNNGFIKVAAATPKIKVDCKHNAVEICSLIREAYRNKTQLIVFPELCITGYTAGDLFWQKALLDNAMKALIETIVPYTEGKEIIAIVGLPMIFKSKLYNMAAVVYDGEIMGFVPKTYIPNYSEFYEGRHFSSGKGVEGLKDITYRNINDDSFISGSYILKNFKLESQEEYDDEYDDDEYLDEDEYEDDNIEYIEDEEEYEDEDAEYLDEEEYEDEDEDDYQIDDELDEDHKEDFDFEKESALDIDDHDSDEDDGDFADLDSFEDEEELDSSDDYLDLEFDEKPAPEPEKETSKSAQTPDIDEVLEIEEPSEDEITERMGKFDTGFVVQGRYDLSATSEIGLKLGLTEEQKQLFSYFVPIRGVSEQLVEILDNDKRCRNRYGTSRTGNILILGRKGSGKTVLAVDIVKAIQKQRRLKQGKVAIVTGDSLNKKDIGSIIDKLNGGALIIEKASKMNDRTIRELNDMMDEQTGELLFLLEDQKKPLERMFASHREFKRKFTSRLELPVFINDELVTFGQTYAKENGYRIDEMGILALYSRIDMMQREDHAVTVAEVKEIMDEAISHSQKANVKHLVKRVFGRSTDNSDHIILKEEDFKA